MRVTVIPTITGYAWGAPGHCMEVLVEELFSLGHTIQWFIAPIDMDNKAVAKARLRGIQVLELPASPKKYKKLIRARRKVDQLINGTRSLKELVCNFSPDFIYINQGGTWDGAYDHFADTLSYYPGRYAVISHLCSEYDRCYNLIDIKRRSLFFSNAKSVFFPSEWCRGIVEMQLAETIDNAKSFRYPHRYRFDVLDFPVSTSLVRIAFVGRLDVFHKGLDLALKALSTFKQNQHAFRFTLYGEGPDKPYLLSLVKHLGLEENIVFAGYAQDLKLVWESNHMLLMPSRMEGCAVALTEAMGFGRVVLTTPVGGATELIRDGVNGYIAEAPHSRLIADKLIYAVSNKQDWAEIGRNACKAVSAFIPDNPAKAFITCL